MRMRRSILSCAVSAITVLASVGCTATTWPRREPQGTVGLLFEGGPNPGVTDSVLDVLARHRVRAIFAIVGDRVEASAEHSAVVQRMYNEGHIVASCGQTGASAWTAWTVSGLRRDIDEADQTLSRFVPRKHLYRYYRPIGGYWPWQRGAWQGRGKDTLEVDSDYGDHSSLSAAEVDDLRLAILTDVDRGRAGLIVLRDGGDGRSYLPSLVEAVLNRAEQRGARLLDPHHRDIYDKTRLPRSPNTQP